MNADKKEDTLEDKMKVASAWFDLANVHQNKNEFKNALVLYQKILTLLPGHENTLQMIGVTLCKMKYFEKAVLFFDKVLLKSPDHIFALSNRGNALLELKRYDEALVSFDEALKLEPRFADCFSNRGVVLQRMRRLNEALASYNQALRLKPNHVDSWYNRGNNLQEMGLYQDALNSYAKALTLAPEKAEIQFNDGLCHLLLGDFKEGFKKYEWRWKMPGHNLIKHKVPRWRGESLVGKRIYLDMEQGLGDMIQFIRFVKNVADLGAYVLVPVPDSLLGLFSKVEGISEIIRDGQAYPKLDYYCPLMSLPMELGIELNTIPNKLPYLYSEVKKRKEWSKRLGKTKKMRIGLAWSGNAGFPGDKLRSIALEKLSGLNSDKIEWHSLHKEYRQADKAELEVRSDIYSWHTHIQDFSDTAALIDLMDVVISVDTAIAHLAGAMNKPVWILLPLKPDWRWLLGREDSPWYQSARLFRQTKYADWDDVVSRISSLVSSFKKG